MANNPLAFRVEMYEEHLEEASFLHEQRLALLDDVELSWIDLRSFEDRLEAHLDALVVGGDLALSVCRRRAIEGDAGELRAALAVFCRAGAKEQLRPALASLDPTDEERMRGAFEGLRLEMPAAWGDLLAGCGAPGSSAGGILLARLAADGGWDPGPAARASLRDGPTPLRREVLRALGTARRGEDQAAVLGCLEDPDPGIAREAARSLLRMGRGEALEWLRRRAPEDPESAMLLALAADRRSAVFLMEEMRRDARRAEAPAVLGLLGDPAAVPWLLERLAEEAAATPAAEALWLITGAPIFEDEIQRPAADPARWSAWWRTEAGRFRPGGRRLLGAPATAAGLLAVLAAPESPNRLRPLLWDQAVIRYGLGASFAADWPVERQLRRLREIGAEARTIDSRLTPGDWVFAGAE